MQHEERSDAPLALPASPERCRSGAIWQRLRQKVREGAFSPEWLTSPWNSLAVGYGSALLFPALAILLTWFLLHMLPMFALQGILALLTTLVVALLWGTGPGLLATLAGAVLLNFFIFHPVFAWSISLLQPFLETVMFLAVGASISLVVGRIEYARKEAAQERAYAAAQARELSILFEAVPDSITVFDREGRFMQMNESARKLLARYATHVDAPIEQRFMQTETRDLNGIVFTSETSPTMRILRGETLRGEQAQAVTVRTFDGEDLWLSVAGAPLYDDAGHASGAVVVTRDLTAQQRTARRTHSALHALLQFAAALVQAGAVEGPATQEADDGVSGIDRVVARLAALIGQLLDYEGVGITAFRSGSQPMATAASGMAPYQAHGWQERRRGFTIHELIAGTPVERQLESGESVVLDLGAPPYSQRPTVYGSKKILLVPMYLEGQPVGVVTCIAGEATYDYTEEEIALARALAQLAALTLERTRLFQERAQAEAAVLALRETNRMMDEFIGIAGHELRTPLTTIKGSVELARRQANRILAQQERLPAEVTPLLTKLLGHLDRTERQIRMQNRLISDLLDVARIHANRLELYPELCELHALVQETVEDQQYMTPARTIKLTSSVTGEVLVMADEDRVRQVISNYLSNALKYSESDRPVFVRLDLSGQLVRVSVTDEGPGLSSAQQERVWERFYRVPEVEVKSGSGVGLGLGLHISRMIIERLGGQVGVESAPGKGSTFWLALPLVLADESE